MVNLKGITGTLPKRPNQIRNWHPELSVEPDLPKVKREVIVIGTTLDVAYPTLRGFQVKVRDGGSPGSSANNSCGKTEGWSLAANGAGSRS
jgi:hypothetical protein